MAGSLFLTVNQKECYSKLIRLLAYRHQLLELRGSYLIYKLSSAFDDYAAHLVFFTGLEIIIVRNVDMLRHFAHLPPKKLKTSNNLMVDFPRIWAYNRYTNLRSYLSERSDCSAFNPPGGITLF